MTIFPTWEELVDDPQALGQFVQTMSMSKYVKTMPTKKLSDPMPSYDTTKPLVLSFRESSRSANLVSLALQKNSISNSAALAMVQKDPSIVLINWGYFSKFDFENKVINKPSIVKEFNKPLAFFKKLRGHCAIPDFTENIREAFEWVAAGKTVYGIRNGKGGILFEDILSFSQADFWTKGKPHKNEFVVTLVRSNLIEAKQIVPMKSYAGEPIDPDELDYRVRTRENGFELESVPFEKVPPCVLDEAVKGSARLGLDFCSIKVLYTKSANTATLISVSSTPKIDSKKVARKFAAEILKLTS